TILFYGKKRSLDLQQIGHRLDYNKICKSSGCFYHTSKLLYGVFQTERAGRFQKLTDGTNIQSCQCTVFLSLTPCDCERGGNHFFRRVVAAFQLVGTGGEGGGVNNTRACLKVVFVDPTQQLRIR